MAVYRATLLNHAKLDYTSVGAWLEGSAETPARVREVHGLADQIKLQYEATLRLRRLRRANGALEFDSAEPDAISSNGVVTNVVLRRHNRARDIIEGFMIAANTQMAAFLEERNVPSLRRVVRTPERWPRIVELASTMGVQLPSTPDARALSSFLEARRGADPDRYPELSLTVMKLMGPGDYRVESPGVEQEGHFGLAVQDYTHSTAPNRRFPDLVTQRLVKAILENSEIPYSVHELEVIAEQCTRMEDLARKIERTTMKAAIATFLGKRIGEEFDGIITGAKRKGTFVRISSPPAEGMLVEGADGLDVGDHVRVRLLSTDPKRGYIDFASV
jgi:exoribonuclease-2